MKIEQWGGTEKQYAILGKHKWNVSRLLQLTKDFPVMNIPLEHLNIYYTYKNLSLREMVMHMRAVLDSDLNYPIILDEDGEVMDGRHRIMHALLKGKKKIKAVRFEKNPEPDEITKGDE